LSVLLGGSASSRLFQKVRERRGLVYTINSGHIAFNDAGLFQIYAGTDPKRVGELIPVIGRELRDVMKNITPAELDRAKAQLRAGILMGQENVMQRADALGHQLLAFNRAIPPGEILRKVLAVTKRETEELAARLFREAPIVTALGPLGRLGDYRAIAAQLRGAA
jgi:predicted Zn-dependent peptidase